MHNFICVGNVIPKFSCICNMKYMTINFVTSHGELINFHILQEVSNPFLINRLNFKKEDIFQRKESDFLSLTLSFSSTHFSA